MHGPFTNADHDKENLTKYPKWDHRENPMVGAGRTSRQNCILNSKPSSKQVHAGRRIIFSSKPRLYFRNNSKIAIKRKCRRTSDCSLFGFPSLTKFDPVGILSSNPSASAEPLMAPKRPRDNPAEVVGANPGEVLANLVRRLAKPSSAHNSTDRDKTHQLAVFLYQYLQNDLKAFVREAGNRPMLVYYSCDGTPVRVQVNTRAQVGDLKFQRSGKKSTEFLAQIGFARYAESDTMVQSRCSFAPPVPLAEGKSAEAHYEVGREFAVSLRQQGHRGIAVHHYCFDRAIQSAMSRMFRQSHILDSAKYGGTQMEQKFFDKQQCDESVGCGLHDAHNSFKWGMKFKQLGTDVLKNVFKVIRALRHSYDLIIEFMASWLVRTVVWTPAARCPDTDTREKLWTMLGVGEDLAKILACDLKLHWDFDMEVMRIDDAWRGRPDAMEQISGALIGVFRFKPFSDSRWVTIGCSCRTLIASMFCGLTNYVKEIRAKAKSDYDIGQWDQLGHPELRFIIMSALVSFSSDAACSLIFEDSRIARIAESVEKEIHAELLWIETRTLEFWQGFMPVVRGAIAGAESSRDDVISGAHISAAYFHMKCLRQVHQYPWCIAIGDQDKNLDALRAGPEPQQPTAAKIWWLLQRDFPRVQLKAGLQLLLDAPWSTSATEQGHSMGALIKRAHPEMTEHSVIARAMVYGFVKLLPAPTQKEKIVERLKKQMAQLDRKKPERVGARQMFFADLMALSNEWQRTGRRLQGADRSQKLMAKHDELFGKLATWQVAGYEDQAERKRSMGADTLALRKQALRVKLKKQWQEVDKERSGRHPLSLSGCKQSPESMDRMGGLWQECKPSTRAAAKGIKSIATAPAIDKEHQNRLKQIQVPESSLLANPQQPRPRWLAEVVQHRSEFDNTVWSVKVGEASVCYKFLFGIQSPQLVQFAPATLTRKPMVAGEAGSSGGDGLPANMLVWTMALCKYLDVTQIPWPAVADIHIHPRVLHTGNLQMQGDTPSMGLVAYLASLPPLVKAPAEKKAKTEDGVRQIPAAVVSRLPWLTASSAPSGSARGSSGRHIAEPEQKSDSEADVVDAATADDLGDDDTEAIYCALEARRREWEATEREVGSIVAFKLSFLKGQWAKKHTGRAWDRAKAYAAEPCVHDWCTEYGMKGETTFTAATYGDDAAMSLARAWASRMNYLYELWLSQVEPHYAFTASDLAGWQMPTDAKDAIAAFNAKQKGFLGDRMTALPVRR